MMDFSEQEKKILEFWEKNRIFEKSLRKDSPRGGFVFYEGPPTANGKPGIHHVEARAFKDLIPRYKTMRGYRVLRKAGWDTHGLPVELEVEKNLGLKNKKEIENYGVENFNKKCRESVWKYRQEWEEMTRKMGFWIDLENPYVTYSADYIETLWWIIKQAHEKDLLYKSHKVVPRCPRCETALSSHEVALGYKNVEEDSIYVKFSAKGGSASGGKIKKNEYILAWTTTPWTLPGNVALAVGEDIDYVKIKNNNEFYILAKGKLDVIDGEYEIIEEIEGEDLVGLEYEPLFVGVIKENDENFKNAFKVYPADFVSTEEGTGVVHTAVMYGVEDYELGEKIGLPKVHTVNPEGTFNELVPKWKGRFVKDAEKEITEDLKNRGLLYKTEKYAHDYPFCWRCGAPLLYYAKDSWFFAMSKLRDDLTKNNEETNWIPEHIKEGRFGEWLREVKDWAISRERYWGTPIPVWQCEKCGEVRVVGSVDEIRGELGGLNKLFLVRHAEAENNVLEIENSLPETKKYSLTDRGIKQAEKVAKFLRDEKIDLIFSSPIRRAKETAEVVSKEVCLEIIFDERLRETGFGDFNNKKYDDLHDIYPSKESRKINVAHGVESGEQVKKRLENFLDEINKKYKNKNIVLCFHGDPIQILYGVTQGLSLEETFKGWYPDNASVKKVYSKPIDLHRPYIDEIKITCACGGKMKRTPEVMDCWFDSGAMPFASDAAGYPADFISEAIDQTRGWFYTLLAVATMLGKKAPYKNVICLGHVLDKNGQKMSKSKGNAVDPMEMIEKYGADTVRWYMYTVNQPGDQKRFDEKDLKQSQRVFNTLLNVTNFYKMFADDDVKNMEESDLTNVLDIWINSKFNMLTHEVTEKLDKYDITMSARKIENFVNDLSTWYVRRSRDRFKNGDKKAMRVLRHIIFNLARLMAPFAPFTSEYIYQEMGGRKKTADSEPCLPCLPDRQAAGRFVESVHLKSWPDTKGKLIDEKLLEEMEKIRDDISIGLDLRLKAGIKVRQPIASLKIKNQKSDLKNNEDLLQLMKDELNVKEIIFDKSIDEEIELDTEITEELKEEGMAREITRSVQNLRKNAGLKPRDEIGLVVETDKCGEEFMNKFMNNIKKATNTKSIKFSKNNGQEIKINELSFKIKI